MSDAPLMLGVSGLRGIVGQSLTPEVAARFAGAFAAWLRLKIDRPKVVVGRDGRAGGEQLCSVVTEELMRSGCDVLELGVAMTPTVGVACDVLRADGAMIVTASHNPQQWNGLKLLLRNDGHAAAPGPTWANQVIELFRSQAHSPGSVVGNVTDVHARASGAHAGSIQRSLKEAGSSLSCDNSSRSVSVVLDSVNSSGARITPAFLASIGCTVRQIAADCSGIFPHPPEPTRENLTSLCDAVRANHADIGFAQDPDADRLAIVDERGEYIGEEYTLALAAESLLSSHPTSDIPHPTSPVLVTNLSTSRMLDDIAARHGARVIRTPVGEANVVEAMKREKAAGANVILGGEGNGGVIWPKVTYVRDSLSAMALVLALMARSGKKVSELVANLPSYAIEKRKVELRATGLGSDKPVLGAKSTGIPAEPVKPVARFLAAIAAAYKDQRLDTQDGIRVDWTRGPRAGKAWLHVRASNTEPIMRLIAEAPTAADAKAILDEAASVIAQ